MDTRILIIAPHADDEVLGVGGTIAKAVQRGDDVCICVVTRGVAPLFSEKYMGILRGETLACHEFLGISETFFLEFPSVLLEKENRHELNGGIVRIIQSYRPTEVYIPHWGDMQKDHQIVAEACMVALRPKYEHRVSKVYAYETPSETGWNAPSVQNEFIPNVYVDVGEHLQTKLEAMKKYRSQLGEYPNPRSIEAIEALAKYRGSTMNMRAAEAFMLIRELK